MPILYGTNEPDRIDGTAGNDTIAGWLQTSPTGPSTDADTLYGRAGDDMIWGGGGDDRLYGGQGRDYLKGDSGANFLDGGDGDDTLDGSHGSGTLLGGDGNDEIGGAFHDRAQVIDGGSGTDRLYFDRQGSTLDFVFSALDPGLTQVMADGTSITGCERFDFRSGSGSDTLTGGEFNDNFVSRLGEDLLVGGAGNDGFFGGGGDDRLIGGKGDDLLYGGAGKNTLLGGAGNDRFATSESVGGQHIFGGTGVDLVFLSGYKFRDIHISLADPHVMQHLGHGTRFIGIEALRLASGTGDNIITGGAFRDEIQTGNGTDIVDGRGGNDLILSDAGNDLLMGRSGGDKISGGDGNDTLSGGQGSDTLAGGDDADFFDFLSAPQMGETNQITDFAAEDTIRLAARFFHLTAEFLSAADFVQGTEATDATDRILYDRSTGAVWFDRDGSGAAEAVNFLTLSAGTALVAADFLIIE